MSAALICGPSAPFRLPLGCLPFTTPDPTRDSSSAMRKTEADELRGDSLRFSLRGLRTALVRA